LEDKSQVLLVKRAADALMAVREIFVVKRKGRLHSGGLLFKGE